MLNSAHCCKFSECLKYQVASFTEIQVNSDHTMERTLEVSPRHSDAQKAWILERHSRQQTQADLEKALAQRDGMVLLMKQLLMEVDTMREKFEALVEAASLTETLRESCSALEVSFKHMGLLAYNSAPDLWSKAAVLELCRRHQFIPDSCIALVRIRGLPRLRVFTDSESTILIAIRDNKSTPLWISDPVSVQQSNGEPHLWETASDGPIALLPVSMFGDSAQASISVIFDDVSIAETGFISCSTILANHTLRFFHNDVLLAGCVGEVATEIYHPNPSTLRIALQILAISEVELEIDQASWGDSPEGCMNFVFESGLEMLPQTVVLSYKAVQSGGSALLDWPNSQAALPLKISMVCGTVAVASATIVISQVEVRSERSLQREVSFHSSDKFPNGSITLEITTSKTSNTDMAAFRSG